MAAYTTIDNPELYFQCDTYTGNGSNNHAQTFDGDENMQPNMVWIKGRNVAENHHIFDSVRGANKRLIANDTSVEFDDSSNLQSFDSDGYTLGTADGINKNTSLFVAWAWKESATSGFDIVSYTGNATARTISHSLSAVPKVILGKRRSTTSNWCMYHGNYGNTKALYLNNNTVGATSTTFWNDTDPTSSVFTVGTDAALNGNTDTQIAYLFSEKQGFSKFGEYTGNGNADGPFVYLGFQPAVVFTKRTDSSGNWNVFDNRRTGATKGATVGKANPMEQLLHPDLNNSEVNVSDGGHSIDGLATGFKIKSSSAISNTSGGDYIYMAFSNAPLTNSNGVPCNAM